MDVQMRNGLPSSHAIVDTNIETGRLKLCNCGRPGSVKQRHQCRPLNSGCFKKRGQMPSWDHKTMAAGDGESVAYPNGILVLTEDTARRQVTKDAVHRPSQA